MFRTFPAAVTAVVAALMFTGCGQDSPPVQASPAAQTTAQPTAARPGQSGSPAAVTPINQITKEKQGQSVVVSGTISGFTASRSERAPNSFQLKDDSAQIRVAIWPDVFTQIPAVIKDGDKVTVRAEVADFRGNMELHVNAPTDIALGGAQLGAAASTPAPANAPAPSPPKPGEVLQIASLTKDRVGQQVTVLGKVESARASTRENVPYVIKITDSSGSIDMVFWQDMANKLTDSQKPEVGDRIKVSGTIDQYRGTLQIRLDDPNSVQTQRSKPDEFPKEADSGTSVPRAAARPVKINEIALATPGELVQVEASVREIKPIRAGREVTLADNGNTARLFLWDTAEGLKPAIHTLKPQDRLKIDAIIAHTDGAKALVVSAPEQILSLTQ